MTTVDFWVHSSDDVRDGISLSNGLTGPATALMSRLQDACRDDVVQGRSEGASLSAAVPGTVLRPMLEGVSVDGCYAGSASQAEYDAFCRRIADDVVYEVNAIDF